MSPVVVIVIVVAVVVPGRERSGLPRRKVTGARRRFFASRPIKQAHARELGT